MNSKGNLKVGVYVDVSNIAQNGGFGMHYDILRKFAVRNNAQALRLNAYVAYDKEEANDDYEYRKKSQNFHATLRDFGYKVIVKTVKWYEDENGSIFGKANADLDMAVDALMQSERLDKVVLVTGDGDFTKVIRALQSKGCRVEVVAFKNISNDLMEEADYFISGFVIPNLIPTIFDRPNEQDHEWGKLNSRVRGYCYSFNQKKGYGFLRFMKKMNSELWITDSREEVSPYGTAFVHHSQFPEEVNIKKLPNRNLIYEFEVVKSDKGLQAKDVRLIYP